LLCTGSSPCTDRAADGKFGARDRLADPDEECGYIVVGTVGYNVSGWCGSPIVMFVNRPVEPPEMSDLIEIEVMAVPAVISGMLIPEDCRRCDYKTITGASLCYDTCRLGLQEA
jgi:hypothetical protein